MTMQQQQPYTADQLLAMEQARTAEEAERAARGDAYWAARDASDVIAELDRKEQAFFAFLETRGFLSMWRVMYAQRHGLDPEALSEWGTQTLNFDGDHGELLRFRVNETRAYMTQGTTMAIGQRPAFECSAINTDYDSIAQVETADNVVTYVYEEKIGERRERKVVTAGDAFGLAWLWLMWDPNGGDDVLADVPITITLADGSQAPKLDPLTGNPLLRKAPSGQKTGDIVSKALYPWDVFSEPRMEDHDDHLWRCVRERRSKYEIANLFPAQREKIIGASSADKWSMDQLFGVDSATLGSSDGDEVVIKHFYHRASPALNDRGGEFARGRYLLYCNGVALLDVPLHYKLIPLVDYLPSEYMGTALGYADAWDLCALNQMIDQVMSDAATNAATYGRLSMYVDKGTSYDVDSIANGARLFTLETDARPPGYVSPPPMSQLPDWLLAKLERYMQSVSALNAVTRGDPGGNVTSGTMAALFHSIAIEANSYKQLAVDALRTRAANMALDILKQYAQHPMVIEIAGKDERAYVETFTRDDLSGIRSVSVRTANPMMRTTAGRMQLAEMLLKIPGAVTTPEQMVEAVVSGQIKPLYDAPRKRRMRIKAENEALQLGPPVKPITPPAPPPLPDGTQSPAPEPYSVVEGVPVAFLDDHADHIEDHFTLLTSRSALDNAPLREAVFAHIEHHYHV